MTPVQGYLGGEWVILALFWSSNFISPFASSSHTWVLKYLLFSVNLTVLIYPPSPFGGSLVLFFSPTCFSLFSAWFCPPSGPSCPTSLRHKETPHPSQKQPHVSPFPFPSPHPRFGAATRKICRGVLFSSEQFCSSQSKRHLIFPSGLHMPSLAGTLQSRWNLPGGQDRASAKRYFPGTYDLMEFWQTFIAKGYAFIFFYRRILLPHILAFRPKTWPYYTFSICWKIFQEAQLYHLPNNLIWSDLSSLHQNNSIFQIFSP